jgi:hypothetical protein
MIWIRKKVYFQTADGSLIYMVVAQGVPSSKTPLYLRHCVCVVCRPTSLCLYYNIKDTEKALYNVIRHNEFLYFEMGDFSFNTCEL